MSKDSSAIFRSEVRDRLVQKFGAEEARRRERAAKASIFAVPKKKFRCAVAQTIRRTGFVVIEADDKEEAVAIAHKPGALADALWEDEEEKDCEVQAVEEIIGRKKPVDDGPDEMTEKNTPRATADLH